MLLSVLGAIIVVGALTSTVYAQHDEGHGDGAGDGSPNLDEIRVAIVGGGIAGASAAFHIHNFSQSHTHKLPIAITIFEASDRVGGQIRSVALPQSHHTVEVGAPHFFEDDWCIMDAVRLLGLQTDFKHQDVEVWDGVRFERDRVCQKRSTSNLNWWFDPRPFSRKLRWEAMRMWWDDLKLDWKYKSSPKKVENVVADILDRWRGVGRNATFASIAQGLHGARLGEDVLQSASKGFEDGGIIAAYLDRFVEPCTRNMYGASLKESSLLDAAVTAGALRGPAMSVKAGNERLVEQLIHQSGAELRLNSTVTDITGGTRHRYWLDVLEGDSLEVQQHHFDFVLLTGDSMFSLSLPPGVSHVPKKHKRESHITHYSSFIRTRSREPIPVSVSWVPYSFLTSRNSTYLSHWDVRSLHTHQELWIDHRNCDWDDECDQFEDVVVVHSGQDLTDDSILRIVGEENLPSWDAGSPIIWLHRNAWERDARNWTASKHAAKRGIEVLPGILDLGQIVLDTAEMGCRMGRNGAGLVFQRLPDDGRANTGRMLDHDEVTIFMGIQ